jgi:hypothetical protein
MLARNGAATADVAVRQRWHDLVAAFEIPEHAQSRHLAERVALGGWRRAIAGLPRDRPLGRR